MAIRIGKPIKQNDPPHGRQILGDGPKTIGQAGCLLCCLVMAARHIKNTPNLHVLEAHLRIDSVDGFAGSGLVLPKAARALGLKVEDRGRFETFAVAAALAADKPVIVGIDYKQGQSSGMSSADHFVLALSSSTHAFGYADPAIGQCQVMDMQKPLYAGSKATLVEAIVLADAYPV